MLLLACSYALTLLLLSLLGNLIRSLPLRQGSDGYPLIRTESSRNTWKPVYITGY